MKLVTIEIIDTVNQRLNTPTKVIYVGFKVS
jgi:hypothetical protein